MLEKSGCRCIDLDQALALMVALLILLRAWRQLNTSPLCQQLERLAGILMVALGLWLGRQAVLGLVPPATDLPLT